MKGTPPIMGELKQAAGASTPALARTIGGAGFFALAFGSIVGSGWVVVLGEWLAAAGPAGAIIGFVAGGLLMAGVAAAYAELVARLPRAGGEFSFVLAGLGRPHAFLTGWFLTLYVVSFTAFEALALAWFLEMLFPALARSPVIYHLLGHDITLFALTLGIGGALLLTLLNMMGAYLAVGLQRVVTFAFIAVSVLLITLGLVRGDSVNWQPLLRAAHEGSVAQGIFWMFATSTLFLAGFQSAANAVEERSHATSMRSIARAMVGAVIAAVVFYCLVILASVSLVPWPSLLDTPLPVAAAFADALPGGLATRIVLIAAIVSLVKTWSALHISASRLVLAQARAGFLPVSLAQVDARHGVPRLAIVFVAICTCAGVFMGRGVIVPIINMSTICVTIIMLLSLQSLLRLRRMQQLTPEFVLPGGTPMVVAIMSGSAAAAVVAVLAPFLLARRFPIEIGLLLAWAAIGAVLGWSRAIRHDRG